MVAMDR